MLPEFDLLTPQTLAEALEMLSAEAPSILPLAGGTNVIVEMRERPNRCKTLMDVSRLKELQGIRRENGHIVIGGGTTVADLLIDPLVTKYGAALRQAAATLGSPLIRNRATVAGNLVDASPAADTAPPLLVLNAELELASQSGTRRVSLEEFITGPNETLIQPAELLVAIRWPVPSPHSVSAFHKIGLRKALACSVVTAATMVEADSGGRCQQVRIALGAVAPTPIRAHTAEDALRGKPLTPESIAEAARLSSMTTRPIDDVRGSAAYRQRVLAVVVHRLLSDIKTCISASEAKNST